MKTIAFVPVACLIMLLSCDTSSGSGDRQQTDSADSVSTAQQTSENDEEYTPAPKEMMTEIQGGKPPIMNFVEVSVDENEGVTELRDATFSITSDPTSYYVKWSGMGDSDTEQVTHMVEKQPGEKYEFQTISQEGEKAMYWITKVDDDGLWVMTNAQNNHRGYILNMDAAIMYEGIEEPEGMGNPDDSPQEVVAALGNDWIALHKHEGKWVIYDECMYGSGGMHLDENAAWIEYSGGGDAWSFDISDLKWVDHNVVMMRTKNHDGKTEDETLITVTGEDMLIFDEGSKTETRYVLAGSDMASVIPTVKEECDEDM